MAVEGFDRKSLKRLFFIFIGMFLEDISVILETPAYFCDVGCFFYPEVFDFQATFVCHYRSTLTSQTHEDLYHL